MRFDLKNVQYTIFLIIALTMLSLGVAAFIMQFTSCKCKSKYTRDTQSMNLSMPNCASAKTWAACMGGPGDTGDLKKCVPIYEGNKPLNNTKEGCWIKGNGDKDDPCMHFLEGGPSPNMVPKTCSMCCSGGYYIKKN